MTSAEQTILKAALTNIATGYGATANFQPYITRWKNDVDAETNGNGTTSEATTGVTIIGVPSSTIALLPATPTTGDFAKVTDANATTNGATVAGGGANILFVKYSGSVWQIV